MVELGLLCSPNIAFSESSVITLEEISVLFSHIAFCHFDILVVYMYKYKYAFCQLHELFACRSGT